MGVPRRPGHAAPWLLRLTLLAISISSASARADSYRDDYTKNDWPVQVILRPLTLAAEMSEVRGDTFVTRLGKRDIFGLSGVVFLRSGSLAPDFYRGITRRLTLGILHDQGLCISDTTCGTIYNDIGVEASYAVVAHGPAQLVARAGFQFPRFRRLFAGPRFGFTTRLRLWRVAFLLEPTLYTGLVGRADDPEAPTALDVPGRTEIVEVPLTIQVQVSSRGLVLLTVGAYGPLANFADHYKLPVGIGGSFTINHRIDLGAELRFTDLITGEADPSGYPTLFLRAAIRL